MFNPLHSITNQDNTSLQLQSTHTERNSAARLIILIIVWKVKYPLRFVVDTSLWSIHNEKWSIQYLSAIVIHAYRKK